MNKIKLATIDGESVFEFPWEWIESKGIDFDVNDLEAKAERGIVTGTLFRKRQAEIPSAKLKISKALTQLQVYPLLKIIRNEKIMLTYFEKYENTYKTIEVYAKKPSMSVRRYPVDDNTNEIIYEPFELQLTAYGGI